MLPLINLIKNWKVISAGIGVVGVVLAGVYFKGIYDENALLSAQLIQAEDTIKKQKQDYKSLEESLIQYQSSLDEQRIKNDTLRNKLNQIGDTNVQECLDVPLPDSFVNSLRE